MSGANPAPEGSVVSIEEMAEALGEDGLFGALDTAEDPHNAVEEPEEEPEDETESEEEPEETTDDEAQETAAESQELESDKFEAMLGLNEGTLSVDDDGQVLFKAKVNGEEHDVPLNDLVTSYQVRKALDQKSNALTEEHRAAMQTVTNQQTELQDQLQQAGILAQGAVDQVMVEYNAINWEELRVNDPAEFAAKRQEVGERYQRVQAQMGQVKANQEALQQRQQVEQQQARLVVKAEQGEKLMQALPEWSDDSVMATEQAGMRDFLNTSGFNPEEVADILDHRQVLVIRKAMLYDQLQKNSKAAKKKVAAVPKIVKPGAKQSSSQGRRVSTNKAMKRLKTSGSDADAAAVFEGLLPDDF